MTNHHKVAIFLTSTGWGGLEMNTAKLAKGLQAQGCDIEVIATQGSPFSQKCKQDELNVTYIRRPKKYYDFRGAYRMAKLLKAKKITHVLVTDNRDIDVMSLCKRLFMRSLKLIYQQHMQLGGNKKSWVHTMRYAMLDRWITPLGYMKMQILEMTKFPAERIEVIALGVDTEKFTQSALTQSEARTKLQLPANAKILGVIGRIDPKKGQLFVVEALAQLRKTQPDLQLLIMGNPTINDPEGKAYHDKIQHYIKANDLSEVVHFRSASSDVMPFYKAIDVFVLPSENETYGMVTIEAMLCGLPIVATNTGGTPEVLDGYGDLFTPYNHTDFIQKIEMALLNTDATISYHAVNRFDLINEHSKILQIIQEIGQN